MYPSTPVVVALVATGFILSVFLHGTIEWINAKCPLYTQDTVSVGIQSTSNDSPSSSSTTDPQFLEKINTVLESVKEGKTDLILPPIDPMVLDSMNIDEGPDNLPIDLKLRNVTIKGLSQLQVTNATNDWKKFEIIYFLSKLEIEGNYDFNANLMSMPISARGPCTFIYENMTVTLSADLIEQTKGGKTFYQVQNMSVFDQPESFTMNIRNLVDGEETFDSIMNKFLNKNFKGMFAETISKANEKLYLGLANMLLSQIPVNVTGQQQKPEL